MKYVHYEVDNAKNAVKEFYASGETLTEVLKKHAITKNVFYYWKRKMGIDRTNGTEKTQQKTKERKRAVKKAVRIKCWNDNIGKDKGVSMCPICKETEIKQAHFEVGHIISVKNGGEDKVSNLKPICEECNKYMGSKNMDDYQKELEEELK